MLINIPKITDRRAISNLFDRIRDKVKSPKAYTIARMKGALHKKCNGSTLKSDSIM